MAPINITIVEALNSLIRGERSLVKKRLLFRRQYLITDSSDVTAPEGWSKRSFSDQKLLICHHPDINYEHFENDQVEIAVIGFLLDPENPKHSNLNILAELAAYSELDDFFKATYRIGGRFLLIRQKQGEPPQILADAVASRELYYTWQAGKFWAAAQPKLMKEFIRLEERNDAAFLDFVQHPLYQAREKNMVGNECKYQGVYHLFPNEYLDLKAQKNIRFWPREDFEPLSFEAGAQKAARLFEGLLKAAHLRYPLMIAFTAGWDSRINVAAARSFQQDVVFYVNRLKGLSDQHPDIFIPSRLSKKLGLNFEIREQEAVEIDPDFLSIYHQNYLNPLDKFVKVYYHFHLNYAPETVNVITGGSGVTRNPFHQYEPKSGDDVARTLGYREFEFVQEQSAKWLASLEKTNYSTPDLLYWEQRSGNWASHASTLPDMARESLSLYNCRDILITMLSVDKKYQGYDNKLYRRIMEILWPEVLSLPFNPPQGLKAKAKHYYQLYGLDQKLKQLGIEKTIRRAYYKLRNRGLA